MSFSVMSQKSKKINEIGLTFTDTYDFGLTYKFGIEKSLWRFNFLDIIGTSTELSYENYTNDYDLNGFSMSIGKEFRKNIVNNMEFCYGADLSFTYLYQKVVSSSFLLGVSGNIADYNIFRPGMNLVLGLNYILKQKIVIGASFLPTINYSIGKNTNTIDGEESVRNIYEFNYGLSNSTVQFTVAYRF